MAVNGVAIIAQWVVFAFFLLLVYFAIDLAIKYYKAGVDVTLVWLSNLGLAVVAALLAPPVFLRLRNRLRVAIYLLGLPAVLALGSLQSSADAAYKRTPQAALEAKAKAEAGALRAKEEAKAAAAKRERERKKAEQARLEQKRQKDEAEVRELALYIATAQEKVQGCINWRGQVPALVREVKSSLHNPRSFEHVHTEMRLKGATTMTSIPMIVMEYRAENGFGALRTSAVTALIAPDDCSVRSVKEYEFSDFVGD
ncbi:hypothetical protein [Phenylobacterium sp.]|jgi:hypothetical protein|uniref:hypothetical protein n=1 Tax=Phenylobacterium sp. TaxID=1871053 RepID=UPI003784257E